MAIILPNERLVLNAYALLVNETPGNAAFVAHQAYVVANGASAYTAALDSIFASETNASLATSMLSNLGLSAIFTQADGEAYLAANSGNRVGAMLELANLLVGYNGSDLALVTAKSTYVSSLNSSYDFSSNSANLAGSSLNGNAAATTFNLTNGLDNFVGTTGDDTFNGFVHQNQNGANANSFSTGDVINGGNGTDTIVATLINDRIVESGTQLDLNVKTTNVEVAKFQVLDEGVVVDAGGMDSVKEFWSDNSDDTGLILEDVRLGSKLSITKEITFGMKDVDFESDLTALFDSQSLKNAGTNKSNSQILVEVGYEDTPVGVDNTNPTKDLFLKISFTHNGKVFDSGFLNTSTTSGGFPDTYTGLKDLIKATLDAQGFTDLVVEFGQDFTSIVTDAGTKPLQVTGKQIFIKDPAGQAFSAVSSAAGANSTDATSDVASRVLPIDPNTSSTLIESNLVLDNAGRGSTAGDVIIGAMSNSNAGVEKINVMVDHSSAIESLNTTNAKLQEIAITSLTNNGDLEIGWTQSGLRLIDASTFAGKNLMLGTTVEAGRTNAVSHGDTVGNVVTTAPVDNLKTLSANVAANVTFIGSTTEANAVDTDQAYSYTTGAGNDTVVFALDGDSVDAEAESFTLTTNSGNDSITLSMDAAGNGVSQSTMSILKNLKVDTGAGTDTVNLNNYGNFNIATGADSDYVRINSVDANGDATTGILFVGNSTGAQTWGGVATDARVLYQAKLTVTYAGLESTVNVNTTAATNFVATQLTINAAIKDAIAASPELAKLLAATDVNGTEQLKIVSTIGGDNDLSIDVFQPQLISTGTAGASQVLINTGDVTALRQGLLATDAFDATTAFTSESFETAAEIATVTSTAGENFFGSVDQLGQGNEDNVYSLNLNATENTGAALTAAGAYAYLNDANGGQNFGTDATIDVNFSTVNLGDGANDLLVVHSNDLAMNTIVIDGSFGKDTVVNFHDLSANMVGVDKNNVGLHEIDFTKLLTNQTDPSTATGANANNTDSAKAIAVTLHDAGNTFTVNQTALNDSFAQANSVNVLHYNEDAVVGAVKSFKFADFTAAQLKDKLNDQAGTVTNVVGGLNDTSLTIQETGTTLVGNTQHHIFMVENVKNLGEYKVFNATSTLDATDKTKLANADVDDFTTVDLLGTIDFGYSINFNLVGQAGVKTLLSGLIGSSDSLGTTVTVQGLLEQVVTTGVEGQGGVVTPPVTPATPTYVVTPAAASANEGTTATFNVVTTNVADGPLAYTLGGTVNAADVTGGLTGTVNIVGGVGTISAALVADAATEGAETLTATLGGVTSNAVTVNDTSVAVVVPPVGTAISVAGNATVAATAAADVFAFDAVTALLDAAGTNTQASITGFDVVADSLQIDLPTANAALTTLAALDGQQGVTVQADPFTGNLLVSFGADANGGELASLTLVGVADAATVVISVI